MDDQKLVDLMYDVFNTPDGKKLLDELVERFIMGKPVRLDNVNEQYFNLGQESLVKMIKQVADKGAEYYEVQDYIKE